MGVILSRDRLTMVNLISVAVEELALFLHGYCITRGD